MLLNYNKHTKLFSVLVLKPHEGFKFCEFKCKYPIVGTYYKFADNIYIIVTPLKVRKAILNEHPNVLLIKTKYPRLRLLKDTIKELFKYV